LTACPTGRYGPPVTEAPPPPPPSPAPPPGTPFAPAVAARPTRSGLAVTAAIILLVVGLAGVIYNAWDLVVLAGDLGLAQKVGVADRFLILITIDVGHIVAGLLQVIAGVQVLAARRVARIVGLVASFTVVALWVVSLLLVMGWDFTLRPHAWAVLFLSVVGSLVAAILLLTSPRSTWRTP
jgi:hypothetical protein